MRNLCRDDVVDGIAYGNMKLGNGYLFMGRG